MTTPSPTQWFEVSLLSDVVITRRWASEGAHESLDYLPGSIMAGIVAARVRPFKEDWILGGGMQFSDALPLREQHLLYPMPLNLHLAKRQRAGTPINGLDASFWSGTNFVPRKQCREGYLLPDGQRIELGTSFRQKTAIDRDQFGRSKDGQLFGYQALNRGASFAFQVTGTEDALHAAQQALCSAGPVRLGRSRSAEFGAAEIKPLSVTPVLPQQVPDGARVALYLVSDAQPLRDGMPCLEPDAKAFDLEKFGLEPCLPECFLRTRRYSPWNSFWKGHTTERQVLVRGSVLVFKRKDGAHLSAEQLHAITEQMRRGVGACVNEGLGWIQVNPVFVINPPTIRQVAGPKLTAATEEPPPEKAPQQPDDDLIKFLANRADNAEVRLQAIKLGQEWAEKLAGVCKQHRHDKQPVPGKSQWAGIRRYAAQAGGDLAQLLSSLNAYCVQGGLKTKDGRVRGTRVAQWVGLHEEINKLLDSKKENPRLAALALMQAAIEMARKLGRKEGRDNE
jgi:hypothetical protein